MKYVLPYLFLLAGSFWPSTGHTNTWRQVNQSGFGDSGNFAVYCLATYGQNLYAGTGRMSEAGEVWRYDGVRWREVAYPGFGDDHNWVIYSMAVFGPHLYASTSNTSTGTEVWRYDGSSWTQVNLDGFGERNNISTYALLTFNNRLYAATLNNVGGSQVWEFNGTSWNRVNRDGYGDPANKNTLSLATYEGFLYAGTSNTAGTEVWRYEGGITWTLTNTNGFGDLHNRSTYAMKTLSGRLFAGTNNSETGAEVWAYDGTSWTQTNMDGFGDPSQEFAMSMAAFNGRLFVGSKNGANEAVLFSYDGTRWSEAEPASFGTGFARAMAVHDEKFYAATDGPGGATLWEYTTATLSQVNMDGFGDEDNHMVLDLETFNDHLYALVQNASSLESSSVQVWEYQGTKWVNVGPSGSAFSLLGVMTSFNGNLYLAANTPSPPSMLISYDGSSWTSLETGQFGDAGNLGITAMVVYQDQLYASVFNRTTGLEVWRFDDTTWSQVNDDGFGDPHNQASLDMAVHAGRLYVATNSESGVEIWQYDGAEWSQVNEDGFGRGADLKTARLCSYQDRLYAGAGNLPYYFSELYQFDGVSWTPVDLSPVGVGETGALTTMGVYQRNLYFGTLDLSEGVKLWAFNGASWTQIVNGSPAFSRALFPFAMTVHDGRLFIGSGSPDSSTDSVRLIGPDISDDGITIDPEPESGTARVWAFHDPGPELVLRANGVEGTLSVTEGTSISLTAGLSPQLQAGHRSDWWFFCLTPFDPPYNFVSLTASEGWLPGLRPFVQYPLFGVMPPAEIFNIPLPAGEYTCAFIIDGNDDGHIDYHWWRTVNMEVVR